MIEEYPRFHLRPNNPAAAFADAGDLQPLVETIHKIARDLDELEGLIAQKRTYVIQELYGMISCEALEVAVSSGCRAL
jgi:hypothetical protein